MNKTAETRLFNTNEAIMMAIVEYNEEKPMYIIYRHVHRDIRVISLDKLDYMSQKGLLNNVKVVHTSDNRRFVRFNEVGKSVENVKIPVKSYVPISMPDIIQYCCEKIKYGTEEWIANNGVKYIRIEREFIFGNKGKEKSSNNSIGWLLKNLSDSDVKIGKRSIAKGETFLLTISMIRDGIFDAIVKKQNFRLLNGDIVIKNANVNVKRQVLGISTERNEGIMKEQIGELNNQKWKIKPEFKQYFEKLKPKSDSIIKCSKCDKDIIIAPKLRRELEQDEWKGLVCEECWAYILEVEPVANRSEYINMIYDIKDDGTYRAAKAGSSEKFNPQHYCTNAETIKARQMSKSVKYALGIKPSVNHSYF